MKSLSLFRSFSTYLVSAMLNQAVNFLLLPVFTKFLSPTEYGLLAVINTTLSVVTILVMTGADGAIRREFYRKSGKQFASFVSSSLTTVLLSFVVVTAAAWWLSGFFESTYSIPPFWLLSLPLIALLNVVYTVVLGQYRVQQQALQFSMLSNLHTLANLGLAVWLVAGERIGYEGRLHSILWTNVLFFIVALAILFRKKLLTTSVSGNFAKDSWKYGLPLIPHQLGSLVVAFADRYFLGSTVGLSETGIYNIGYTIGSIIGVLEGTFGLAFIPFLFENLKNGSVESQRKIMKTTMMFAGLLLLAVLLLWGASGLIFKWFINERYWEGQRFVLPVAIGYFFAGCYKIASGFIYYTGKTINLTYLAIVNAVSAILLNFMFIKWWGAMGAALATMSCFFIMFILTAIISHRLMPMPWILWLLGRMNAK